VSDMIAMLDTSEDLGVCQEEIGCAVEQLFTPLTRFSQQNEAAHYAVDNGAYSKFDAEAFLSLLQRQRHVRHLCRFVAVPDVVASARRTMEVFEHWAPKLQGWPLALVAQDGLEDLDIPWERIQAIFIGGSTSWKMSSESAAVIKAALALGKWVHVGRVNTPGRFEYFESLGAHSIDGSGLARFSWMRERIHEKAVNPKLFAEVLEVA
jgi:hypothetical protein